MKNSKFTPATFVIDGNDPEGQPITAQGIHNTAHNWNGFAVPYFTKGTALYLCKALGGAVLEFNSALDCVIQREEMNDGIKVLTQCGTTIVDGIKYYIVGDSWTWEVLRHPYDELSKELEDFCKRENLPLMSADDLAAELRHNRRKITEQILYLDEFVERWDSIGK